MSRYAIQHKPSQKYVREDYWGVFLESDECIITYKTLQRAKEVMEYYRNHYTPAYDNKFYTECGSYYFDEFEIVKV